MSRENVEVVRRVNDAFQAGDGPAMLELVAEGVVVTQPPSLADARRFVGHDGMMQAIADWASTWDDWQIELRSLIDAGTDVVAVFDQRGRGKVSGAEVTVELGCVFSVEDGRISRWQMFFSEAEALEAVGLRE